MAEKPFFRHFLENKRCLIVADSFYEWGEVNLEGKTEKYPFNFYLEGRPYYACTIITTAPNPVVKKVHNRMPVTINEKDEDSWLDCKNQDAGKLQKLLVPYSGRDFKMQIVSKRVNDPGQDDEGLINQISPIR